MQNNQPEPESVDGESGKQNEKEKRAKEIFAIIGAEIQSKTAQLQIKLVEKYNLKEGVPILMERHDSF